MKAACREFRKRYWDERSATERRALLLAAAVLSPLVAYFLLWQPAHMATGKLTASLPLMRTQAEHVKLEAAEAETLRHSAHPAVLDANALKAAVLDSAAHNQLSDAITSVETQEPNAVRIALPAVSFEQWLAWLRALQQEQHIRVDAASVTALPQAGQVKVNATLTNGGP